MGSRYSLNQSVPWPVTLEANQQLFIDPYQTATVEEVPYQTATVELNDLLLGGSFGTLS